MKIAIFTNQVENPGQGSGVYVKNIVSELGDLDHPHEITLVRRKEVPNEFYRNRKTIVLPSRLPDQARALSDFDLIHFSTLSYDSPLLDLEGKQVITIYGAAELFTFPRSRAALKKWYRKKFQRPKLLKRLDGVVTVSKNSRDFLLQEQRVPSEKLCLAPCGADDRFRVLKDFEPRLVKEKFGLGDRYVYHISHFMPRKNPRGIIKAFENLVSQHGYSGQLVLSGKGWDEVEKMPAARRLLRDRRVVITGYVSDSDSVELLNAADCFLFPSLYEGFGIPNIEAMACGCPVVSSDRYAISEVVGAAGLLVKNPHDYKEISQKLHTVVSSDELRRRLAAEGLERAKLFDWKRSAQTILGFYEELMESE